MTRTIRRNSKEFTAAFANARDIVCFSLSNCFNGSTVATICDYDRENCKLVHDGVRYKARVHSNLWYEFNAG